MNARLLLSCALLVGVTMPASAAPNSILLGPAVEFAPASEIDGRDVRYIG